MSMARAALLTTSLLAAVPAAAQDPEPPSAEQPTPGSRDRNYVAAVIGLSTYQNLPGEVELDFARSDAATVARALRKQAGFDQVFLLTDGQATREAVRDLLRNKVPQHVGPNDLLILYFAGHGVGADLDLPVLLTYDSTLENGQEDGLELQSFARDLQTWLSSGQVLVVTDAIHRNQLDGIHFYGPSADQWPPMSQGTMILSSSRSGSPGTDGAFGKVFADAVAGAADADHNRRVTASELFTHLLNNLSPTGQVPVAGGDFDARMVIAEGVESTAVAVKAEPEDVEEEVRAPREPVYPNYEIDKAKFVWSQGASHAVQCREQPVAACSPSCYVWAFKAGPCQLSAVVDGARLEGEVVVLQRGMYACGREGDKLTCKGP